MGNVEVAFSDKRVPKKSHSALWHNIDQSLAQKAITNLSLIICVWVKTLLTLIRTEMEHQIFATLSWRKKNQFKCIHRTCRHGFFWLDADYKSSRFKNTGFQNVRLFRGCS